VLYIFSFGVNTNQFFVGIANKRLLDTVKANVKVNCVRINQHKGNGHKPALRADTAHPVSPPEEQASNGPDGATTRNRLQRLG
jgi:hypothetical protein